MTRLTAADRAARADRRAAIDACPRCDHNGWLLANDGTDLDVGIRCGHGAPAPSSAPVLSRDITEPIHGVAGRSWS